MSRRSQRRVENLQKAEEERVFSMKVANAEEDGLTIFDAGVKGRGVKSTKSFSMGEYVAQYNGELISQKEAIRRY